MKKIPYGISDYKKLKEKNLMYVDKTMYLEKLENNNDTLIYLRPGRFGKSLFTSMMFYYYDLNSKDLFENLFKETYVYQNPTPNKNNYYVLKFDFSGLKSTFIKKEDLELNFKIKVIDGLRKFNNRYNFDLKIDEQYDSNIILTNFLTSFETLKLSNKIYMLIDEYDNFTNAILEGDASIFKDLLGKNGAIKSFYAVIKENMGTIIDRFFATGICPITLNSMTTGFNIATDLSRDYLFNEMIGLTHEEVKSLIKEIVKKEEQEDAYNLMIEYYDGYLFNEDAKERVFNATLVMYFLDYYENYDSIPKSLYDANIIVNYDKIDNLLKLQNNNFYPEITNEILKNNEINGVIIDKFNLAENVNKNTLINLLYYFGCLTVSRYDPLKAKIVFKVPNKVMEDTYENYFIKLLESKNIVFVDSKLDKAREEVILNGDITYATTYASEMLTEYGSRMFLNFSEKNIQVLFKFILKHPMLEIKLEEPIGMGYVDLMIFSKHEMAKYNLMIEFKYIKKSEFNESLLKEKIEEGTKQLKSYNLEINNLKKYLIIFVGNECRVIQNII